MNHRTSRLTAAVTASATLALSAVGGLVASSSAGAATSPFRVVIVAALTTQYLKTNAQTEVLLTRAAATVINKSGGVAGHKVTVTAVNTNGNPTTAVTKLQAVLGSSTKPNMVILGSSSAETSAELPVATRAKILTFNDAPSETSGTPKVNPYNFDISPSTTNYVQSFVAYTKSKGIKKIGIFAGNDAYGTAIGASMNKAAKAAGLTVTDSVQYKVTGLTFTSTLAALQASKPQLLWADAYNAPAGYLLQDLQKIGWSVPVLGDDSFSVSTPITTEPPTGLLGTSAEKNLRFQTFKAAVWAPASKTPKNTKTMLAAMRRTGSPKASLLFGYDYDAVIMTAYAARSSKTLTTAGK